MGKHRPRDIPIESTIINNNNNNIPSQSTIVPSQSTFASSNTTVTNSKHYTILETKIRRLWEPKGYMDAGGVYEQVDVYTEARSQAGQINDRAEVANLDAKYQMDKLNNHGELVKWPPKKCCWNIFFSTGWYGMSIEKTAFLRPIQQTVSPITTNPDTLNNNNQEVDLTKTKKEEEVILSESIDESEDYYRGRRKTHHSKSILGLNEMKLKIDPSTIHFEQDTNTTTHPSHSHRRKSKISGGDLKEKDKHKKKDGKSKLKVNDSITSVQKAELLKRRKTIQKHHPDDWAAITAANKQKQEHDLQAKIQESHEVIATEKISRKKSMAPPPTAHAPASTEEPAVTPVIENIAPPIHAEEPTDTTTIPENIKKKKKSIVPAVLAIIATSGKIEEINSEPPHTDVESEATTIDEEPQKHEIPMGRRKTTRTSQKSGDSAGTGLPDRQRHSEEGTFKIDKSWKHKIQRHTIKKPDLDEYIDLEEKHSTSTHRRKTLIGLGLPDSRSVGRKSRILSITELDSMNIIHRDVLSTHTLHVGNLPFTVTRNDIKALFPNAAEIKMDPVVPGQEKSATVRFDEVQGAFDGFKSSRKAVLHGRPLIVSPKLRE